jgi:hypothetical protein
LSPDDEKNQALATNGKYDTYQRRTSWNIIKFLWYLYLPIFIYKIY